MQVQPSGAVEYIQPVEGEEYIGRAAAGRSSDGAVSMQRLQSEESAGSVRRLFRVESQRSGAQQRRVLLAV